MKVLIAAGGTGGHVNPALAVAGEIKKQHPEAEICFVGTADRIEADIPESMEIGDIYQIIPSYISTDDSVYTGEKEIYYESEDPSIVYVDKNGQLTAKKAGKTVINAFVLVNERIVKHSFDIKVNDATELVTSETNIFTADFTFAPVVNGILLLTSTVRVSVCLASGGITYFNGENYIRNYRRDIYGGDLPDIKRLLPVNVRVEKTVLCFAEIDGRHKLCVLAVCDYSGEKVDIYIDYNTMKIIKNSLHR